MSCFSEPWSRTGDVETALAMANMYAADSVTKLGTQTSYATMEEFAQNYDNVTA